MKRETGGAIIGLDIGGSKTRGIRWVAGDVAGDATSGSANLQNVTPAQARYNLTAVFAALGEGPVEQVIAGSGAIDTDDDANALKDLIQPLVREAKVSVVHDSRLLLAAAGHDEGIALIAGTGSAAWGTDSREQVRVGGWGYLLGDEGSGYWLAREAVRYSLKRMNDRHSPDALTQALLDSCGIREPVQLIALFHTQSRDYWASKAHIVFDAAAPGHPVASKLVHQAGADLAAMAIICAQHLSIRGPIVLGGGLGMNHPKLQRSILNALGTRGPYLEVLNQDPVFGALHLARAAGQLRPVRGPGLHELRV